MNEVGEFHQERRAKSSTFHDLKPERFHERTVGFDRVPIADVPAHGFIGANLSLVLGVIRIRATQMENPTIAEQFIKVLNDQFIARNVFQGLRADDLIKFLLDLGQIIQVENLKFQPLGIRSKEREVLRVFLDLSEIHRHAQDTAAKPIGRVGERPIAAPRVQCVDGTRSEVSG